MPCLPHLRPPSAPKPDWDAQEADSALLAPCQPGPVRVTRPAAASRTTRVGRWERQFPTVRQTVRRHPATSPDSGAATTRSGARLVLASFSTTSSTLGDCVEPDNNFRAFTSVQGGADGQDFNCSSAVTAGTECSVEETTGFSNCSVNDSSDHPGCSAGQWPGAGGRQRGAARSTRLKEERAQPRSPTWGKSPYAHQFQQRRNRP